MFYVWSRKFCILFFFSSNLSEGVLGFDCEWVNEGPVCLLQLATFNGVCALFRIGKIGYIPDKLKVTLEVQNGYNYRSGITVITSILLIDTFLSIVQELLSNKRILKVGVASFEDGQKVLKDHGCQVSGTLDVRSLAKATHLLSLKSLAAMSLEYLSLEMDKLIELRCGDWEASTLTDEQVKYAACDAIISILIYQKVK